MNLSASRSCKGSQFAIDRSSLARNGSPPSLFRRLSLSALVMYSRRYVALFDPRRPSAANGFALSRFAWRSRCRGIQRSVRTSDTSYGAMPRWLPERPQDRVRKSAPFTHSGRSSLRQAITRSKKPSHIDGNEGRTGVPYPLRAGRQMIRQSVMGRSYPIVVRTRPIARR